MNARNEAPSLRPRMKMQHFTLRVRRRLSSGIVERSLDSFFGALRRKRGKK